MTAQPVEPPEDGPGVGRNLDGYVLVPAAWVKHYEELIEERDDAEAARIADEIRAGVRQTTPLSEVEW
ncbi:hypothetical protein ACIBFB_04200 [Nocardiopsis sp. NPDC050513]|uniref:hypothetical protein n=1 Tax=unclassified Nocardiopsis TaxID=2649073 RepID=UPI0009602232|nr:hypothetical protein [Nocardiopsis sp. CNR-923]OLT28417.1 hypothetical protein BJF83_15290 [Nocardiopsis sp. CNR-923]